MKKKKSVAKRIRIPNSIWWFGLVILLLSGIVGYLTYAKAVSLVPGVISTYKEGVLSNWRMNLPLLVNQGLSTLIGLAGAVLAIFCFFYGLRYFIPLKVPTGTPKDFRNQIKIPELLKKGDISTFYIPNSKMLKIIIKVLRGVRYLSKIPKYIIISNFTFIIKGGIFGGLLMAIHVYRLEIFGLLRSAGLNVEGISIPSLVQLAILVWVVTGARLFGAATLIRAGRPNAKALMSSVEYRFDSHPNTIYSALQKASEKVRRGNFPNRIHIDESRLVPTDPPEMGTFDGMVFVETHPKYNSSPYRISTAILVAAGAALVAYAFKFYLSLVYSTAPLPIVPFLKAELPLYVRNLLFFIVCVFGGKVMLVQALSLLRHYRYSSVMIHSEFNGTYQRIEGDEDREIRCRVSVIFRTTSAISETYRLWGRRELLSFAPSGKSDEILHIMTAETKKELETKVS